MEISKINATTGIITTDSFLDARCEEEMKSLGEGAFETGINKLVLDFSSLVHMNNGGVNILVKLAAYARQRKKRLFVAGLNDRYKEIFKMTGLNECITIFSETGYGYAGLTHSEINELSKVVSGEKEQDDRGWAPDTTRLKVTEKPQGAMNLNVNGRRAIGPLQGFGPLWQKTYLLRINQSALRPHDVITIMKQHFPEFQPSQNKFYPSNNGIAAGEIVLIDSSTPGGLVSTGVLVLYSDDLSFTLMTPQGHPEAGWVTFSAREADSVIEMQIQGLASASDPVYELAFRIAGSKFQETIWKHVLSSLASFLDVEPDVQMAKTCIRAGLQWSKTGNIWYNAQIRSLPYNIPRWFGKQR